MDVGGGTAVLNLLSTAVLLLDAAGRIAFANLAAEELFESSQRALAGRPVAELLGADQLLQARVMDILSGKVGALRQPLSVHRRDTSVPVNIALVPLQEEPWSALVELRVAEQHLLMDRHQQLGKELAAQRETLRNLAHEVKNPLGGIRGAAQLLDGELDTPELQDYTRLIMAEADRVVHLVDRLLAPQGANLRKEPLNIHEVCERVRTLVGAEFATIEVHRDYDASLPEMKGDFSCLLQAMLNIARNAAQALTEHAAQTAPGLTLRTRVARQVPLAEHPIRLAVVVSLIDNGPGIAPELADKVFHPLVTGRAQGSGLGLSLAQEFVQQHGGILECDSRPGHTEFRMILPLEPS